MSLRVSQSIHDFAPTIEWDEQAEMVADNLSVETIWKLKERWYNLIQEINSIAILGSQEEILTLLIQRANLQGKAAFIEELLDDDKNVKGRLAVAPE